MRGAEQDGNRADLTNRMGSGAELSSMSVWAKQEWSRAELSTSRVQQYGSRGCGNNRRTMFKECLQT